MAKSSTALSEPPRGRTATVTDGRSRADRAQRIERIARIVAPLTIGAIALVLWEAIVALYAIPHYILPGPRLVLRSLIEDWARSIPRFW